MSCARRIQTFDYKTRVDVSSSEVIRTREGTGSSLDMAIHVMFFGPASPRHGLSTGWWQPSDESPSPSLWGTQTLTTQTN
jgi:hypothetical protein